MPLEAHIVAEHQRAVSEGGREALGGAELLAVAAVVGFREAGVPRPRVRVRLQQREVLAVAPLQQAMDKLWARDHQRRRAHLVVLLREGHQLAHEEHHAPRQLQRLTEHEALGLQRALAQQQRFQLEPQALWNAHLTIGYWMHASTVQRHF